MMAALAVVKAAHATSVALAARGEAEQGDTMTGWAAKLQESCRDGGGSPIRGGGGGARREGGGGGDAAAAGVGSGEGVRAVAALLLVLSKAYQHLMQFRCPEALQELGRLPPQQYCTGWVLHQVGRAYFERADYGNAKSALESMQRYDPHRMEGLDLLSTTLWHLKRDVELSYLAQKVSEFDRRSPQTWCVVGNCFSLQKEHETALRFFQRAIQLDADMTYAYTLCGHEYVANEDFDKAVACFRMAIRTDRRHYNAWYGLGSIYHRQEKYDMAEYHFRRALKINPQSSVLRVYLGMVLHANKRYLEALDMLELASKSEPRNPQASFQRANVLMSMERYAEALRELEVVRDNVPKESAVYFLMGKVCKKLGQTDAAMRHFTIALDLHNKDKNLIKAAVDRLNDPDMDEEEKF
ncbi:Putative subunit of the Anaphase Promoting Complex [Ectocarpus siliculosus]|uniref:Subunit of the Anaphase Promoting Complex n=1 Tax=Ectocarpus siliculosus TaxID=2880 RepID=D7FXT2_ECTSI|nr:Putative subunit of the Anaphase Promoting Complex [Ectocarpus siliculosus]|eukprot:CBJ32345.1 Putative subunit of the Anaphase Promoting Complex [Ectocarpus siliculosus]